MKRRSFLALAAAGGATAAVGGVPTRSAKVEKAFDSPGPKPNGLQCTDEGLWILDQGDNRVCLVDYAGGKTLRKLDTASDRGSGLTFDGEAIWIASTYDRKILRVDAHTGKTLAERFTPGAGVIYQQAGDAPGRSSPLAPAAPARPRGGGRSASAEPRPGTGAHGMEWRDGKLWVTVPPARMVYRIDPESWVVEKSFPTAGNRPHGIGWDGDRLWVTDSNLNAFFLHDTSDGRIVERIQLADDDPLPHGMSIRGRTLWYCDDVGIVCRLSL